MSETKAEYVVAEVADMVESTSAAADPAQAVDQQQHSQGDGPHASLPAETEAARSNAEHGTAQGRPDGSVPSGAAEPAATADASPTDNEARGSAADAPALSAEQLGRLRETLIAANPDAVPELIAGQDFDALLGSVDGAKAAFARIKGAVQGEPPASLPAGPPASLLAEAAGAVPRGGMARTVDPATYASLSPQAKIALGVELAGRQWS